MANCTAQEVFSTAMTLMDEVSAAGLTDTSETAEYKRRSLAIINMLGGELYRYSDTYTPAAGNERPVIMRATAFDEPLDLDEYICLTVLPYGLAAHLLLDENQSAANFFQSRYEELKADLRRGLPKVSEDIEDVYSGSGNGIGFEWTTRW